MLMSLEIVHETNGSKTRNLNLKENRLRVGTPVIPNSESYFKERKMAEISYSELRTKGGEHGEADKYLLIKTSS